MTPLPRASYETESPPPELGGWLIVFVVTSTIGCLSLAFQLTHSRTPPNTLLIVFLLVSNVLTTGLTLFRSPLVFPALIVQFAAHLGLRSFYLYTIWKLHGDPRYKTMTHDVSNQIFSLSVMIQWLVYFHYSKRVRKTFGENL